MGAVHCKPLEPVVYPEKSVAPAAVEEDSAAEEPAAEEDSAAEEPAVEEDSAAEEPAVEEDSAAEEPAVEEDSAAEEPAAEEDSAAEEPAAEEDSAAEEPESDNGKEEVRIMAESSNEVPHALATLEHIVKFVAEKSHQVQINVTSEDDTVSMSVTVGDGDMGRVIGRRGRIANAIRTVVPLLPLPSVMVSQSQWSSLIASHLTLGSNMAQQSQGCRELISLYSTTIDTDQMKLLEVARVGKAHGLKGEVSIHLISNISERIELRSVLYLEDEREMRIQSSKQHKKHYLVLLEGITSRTFR